MTTHTRLRLGAVALVLLVVVLLSGAHLCGVAQDPGSRPLSAGALACTEFWLNRYQTLLGAAAALIAAAIAWIGIRKQLEKADEQIVVTTRQSAIALLPVLDQRTENAAKTYRAADVLGQCGFDMYAAAERAFGKAEELHRSYVTGDAAGRMVDVFGASVKDYKQIIEMFSGVLSKFVEERSRGLSGPNFRKASGEIWVGAIDLLQVHKDAYERLERCTGNRFRSNEEIETGFAAIGPFKPSTFVTPDLYYAIPLRILAHEVELMQAERDQCFERSRT